MVLDSVSEPQVAGVKRSCDPGALDPSILHKVMCLSTHSSQDKRPLVQKTESTVPTWHPSQIGTLPAAAGSDLYPGLMKRFVNTI